MSQNVLFNSIADVNAVLIDEPSIQPKARELFSSLAREHHQMVILYARAISGSGEVAQDLAQDAFLAGWQSWVRFDPTRDFGTWIRGIIRNKWREHCRKNARMRAWDEEALSRLEKAFQEMPVPGLFDQLEVCLEKLPETLRDPVVAHYYEDLSTAEAAAKLDASEPATRKRLQRAREALKECLSKSQSNQTVTNP
jgi:RNA polymerase sigma-70 factor (ECF subfamily)